MTRDEALKILKINVHLQSDKTLDSSEYREAYKLATTAGSHLWRERVNQAKGVLEGFAAGVRESAVLLTNYWTLLNRFYDADKQTLPKWSGKMHEEQKKIETLLDARGEGMSNPDDTTGAEKVFRAAIDGLPGDIGNYMGINEEICVDGYYSKEQLKTIVAALDKADAVERVKEKT